MREGLQIMKKRRKDRGPGKSGLRLQYSAKTDMARLMGNPGVTVTGSPEYFQNGPALSPSIALHFWLREALRKYGLGQNAMVGPERLDLRLLVNFAPMTRSLR